MEEEVKSSETTEQNEVITSAEVSEVTPVSKTNITDNVNAILNKNIGPIPVKYLIVGILAIIVVLLLGKIIFGGKGFPDYPLLYVNDDKELMMIGKGEKKGVKIANLDAGYTTVVYSNTSDKYVLYKKDSNLYLYNTRSKKDPVKVGSSVSEFGFTENDKYVYFVTEDDDLYVYDMKDKTKLDSGIGSIKTVTGDKIIYSKDGSLYIRSVKPSKDDRSKIIDEYDDFYLSDDEKKVLVGNDDLYIYKVSKKEKEKIASDYSSVIAYEEDFDEILYTKSDDGERDVYLYNGKKSEKIINDVYRVLDYDVDNMRLLYTKRDDDDVEFYVYSNKKEIKVYDEAVDEALFDGKDIYFLVEEDGDSDTYELYYTKLSGSKVSSVKSLDTGVSEMEVYSRYTDLKGVYYIVDEKDSVGDLKVASGGKVKSVGTDVYGSGVIVTKDRVFFLGSYDKKDSSGDLFVYSGGSKSKKIASEVNSLLYINDDYMYLIKEYKNGKCDLYSFNGKKEKLVAQDVLDIEYSGIRYNYYKYLID